MVSGFIRWLKIKSIDDSLIAFFISGALLTLIAALFLSNCLITQLRTDGIYIRFPLLDPSVKQFLWSDIQELYITDYNPMEYGGWEFASVLPEQLTIFPAEPVCTSR